MLGQYEEALTHYEIAIKKKNSDGLIFYNRGLTHSTLQRFEEAKKDFHIALEKGNLVTQD
jgi:tetratricopeptide (TPR) repeat protein